MQRISNFFLLKLQLFRPRGLYFCDSKHCKKDESLPNVDDWLICGKIIIMNKTTHYQFSEFNFEIKDLLFVLFLT